MASLGERFWEMGKSPSQHLTLLTFGLVTLLAGLVVGAIISLSGPGGFTSLAVAAIIVTGIGAFFVTLALFLGAYVSSGESGSAVAWRIAQLIAAVLVLLLLFR